MAPYKHSNVPQDGATITVARGRLQVPERPIIPYIQGDGIGPDIWNATQRVVDAAVAEAYGRERAIAWMEVLAGEKAFQKTGEWLPEETFEAMREFRVAIKGPLTTPVGGGNPLTQRDHPSGTGPILLHSPRALDQGHAVSHERARSARRGDLPREHRGPGSGSSR